MRNNMDKLSIPCLLTWSPFIQHSVRHVTPNPLLLETLLHIRSIIGGGFQQTGLEIWSGAIRYN